MKYLQMIAVVAIFGATAVSGASGQKTDLKTVVSRLQDNYKEIKDYRASFIQEAKIKGYPRPQITSGEVFYKKPGMMRWNYDKPEPQEIVTDGKVIWMYSPSLDQVMKADFAKTSQSKVAEAFLSGMGNISEDFNISIENVKDKEGDLVLMLTPKDERDPLKSIELSVDRETFYVRESVMTDIYGNVTTVSLNDFKVNTGIKKKMFDFVPPEGVEIIAPPAM
ncbi:MAG: outer membrane lipoprotein chaperone LolA [bacterium]|nr:outer membrane lipoprotein chaperone LolA [bacterium]